MKENINRSSYILVISLHLFLFWKTETLFWKLMSDDIVFYILGSINLASDVGHESETKNFKRMGFLKSHWCSYKNFHDFLILKLTVRCLSEMVPWSFHAARTLGNRKELSNLVGALYYLDREMIHGCRETSCELRRTFYRSLHPTPFEK